MGLLDGLEKLINEHGSATILKERIALANDKFSALEKEFAASKQQVTDLKARVTELETENQSLKLDNEKLRQEIQRRDNESEKEKSHGTSLEEIKVKILTYMANYEETYVGSVASALGIGLQTAQFHMEELVDANMINMSCYFGGESTWYLAQDGRKYLVRNNLIA